MYYVFSSALLTWRNSYVQAAVKGAIPVYEPHWWEGRPLAAPLPTLTFEINANTPIPDNLFTGTEFQLYSKRMIEQIEAAGVFFETFPVVLRDKKNNVLFDARYSIFHLLEVLPALDQAESDEDFSRYRIDRGNAAELEIRQLVLTRSNSQLNRPLFRVKENRSIVLIHSDLKTQMELIGITGCQFTPINDYRVGLRTR